MNADHNVAPTTAAQAEFRLSLTHAARKLFDMLGRNNLVTMNVEMLNHNLEMCISSPICLF